MGYGQFPRMGHNIWLFHDGRPNHIETKDLHHKRVQHLNLKWHGLFCFLKGCLTQILLDPLSNTSPRVFLTLSISYSLFLLFTTFPSVLIHGLLINKIKSYTSWPCEWNFEVMQRHASLHTLIAQYEGKSLRHWKSKKSLPIMIKKN